MTNKNIGSFALDQVTLLSITTLLLSDTTSTLQIRHTLHQHSRSSETLIDLRGSVVDSYCIYKGPGQQDNLSGLDNFGGIFVTFFTWLEGVPLLRNVWTTSLSVKKSNYIYSQRRVL